MKIGIKFPTRDLGNDTGLIREWAAMAAESGFQYIALAEHVLGVKPELRTDDWAREWPVPSIRKPYTTADAFHEPLMLGAFLAACCPLEICPCPLILPQRQTVLVAKQAAELDIFCQGRMRLTVSNGWNPVEYEALGQDFKSRGRRMSEQIKLLRALWTEEAVVFEGEFDSVIGAGITPLPIQRPIPIWLAGWSDPVMRRVGELADGWMGGVRDVSSPENLGEALAPRLQIIHDAARAAGRDPAAIGLEGNVAVRDRNFERLEQDVQEWIDIGATHLAASTMGTGYSGREQLEYLHRVAEYLIA